MTNDYHLGLIEGWLLAKEAPDRLFESIKALRKQARLPEQAAIHAEPVIVVPEHEVITTADEETEPAERKKRNWSPEARAAAAERMRARQAARFVQETNDDPGNG